ncbi:hypothetical protein ACFL56_02280 [Candidatus Margulisiibacteriota bacterium]
MISNNVKTKHASSKPHKFILIYMIIILALILISPLHADYIDKDKFHGEAFPCEIKIPSDWKGEEKSGSTLLVMTSPDGVTEITLRGKHYPGGASVEKIAKRDVLMYNNWIFEGARTITGTRKMVRGAEAGAIALYSKPLLGIGGTQQKIINACYYYTKGENCYILRFRTHDTFWDDNKRTFEDILKSFKIK